MKAIFYLLRVVMFLCTGYGAYILAVQAEFATAFLLLFAALVLFSVSSIVNETIKVRKLRNEQLTDNEFAGSAF